MQSSEVVEKIRQQYESEPYPNIPIDRSPKQEINVLQFHNIVIPYYLRNQQVIHSEGQVILDAGCGSGYKALILAEANPGAKIVGVDLSPRSIEVARDRLKYHNFENFEFHVMPLEELPSLGLEFDYINNDEVLYLLPDLVAGLKAMKSVLKPDGIIRTNLHSAYQRAGFFRAQKFCKTIGLMDGNPEDFEVEILKETMEALKNGVNLKQTTWGKNTRENPKVSLMNHLLQGDKGYTIPEAFSLLEAAGLEFIKMLNARQWDLKELFQTPDNLPAFWAMSVPGLTVEEQLHLYELLHPVHRLIDFWCGHPNQAKPSTPVTEWNLEDWQNARVYWHPQLKKDTVKKEFVDAMTQINSIDISRYLPMPGLSDIWVDSSTIACLLPLWEESQSTIDLAQRWHQLRPVDPTTLQPIKSEEAWETVTQMLITMVEFGYVLVER
ncbi:MAG: class I SAM-dependent methyltransferase [Geitlerinemataceae cyanobacterium]